jgi:hypothetical protein
MSQPDEIDLEAPEADAAEQAAYADPREDEGEDQVTVSDDIEAPEWDALEQAQVVHVEDDY